MFFYLKFMWEKRALNGSVLNQIEMFPIFEQDLISDSISAAPKHHMVQTPIDLPFFRSISLFSEMPFNHKANLASCLESLRKSIAPRWDKYFADKTTNTGFDF